MIAIHTQAESKFDFWRRQLFLKIRALTRALPLGNGHSLRTQILRSFLAKFPNFESACVYDGEGAVWQGPPIAQPISPEEILQGNLKNFSTLIMPGGHGDRFYHASLKGAGNTQICSFVRNGGTYLGICAGAYYGCSRVEFDEGYPLEVCEDRELKFFQGTAIGPAFGKGTFEYNSEKGARIVKLSAEGGVFHAYYNGGCSFIGDFSNVRILSRYLDLPHHPPAIIECPFGKGRAILSGVHLELSDFPKNSSSNQVKMEMKDHLARIGAIIGE